LLIRSFIQMCKVDPGFRPERLVAFDLPRPIVDFNDPNRPSVPLRPFFVEVLRRVGEIPGIESAALANALPLTKRLDLKPIVVEGRAEPVNWNKHDLRVNALIVTPEYFHTLGIPIFRGRAFSIDDRQDAPLVAVINQAMARRFWPAEDPIGKRFRVGVNPNWTTVIGISGSLRQPGSTQTELPGMFRPLAQEEPGWMSLVVRARGDFAGLAREVQRQIWQVDANQPISKVVALEQLLEQSVAFPRFRSLVMGLFAALALLQVTVGIYGLVAYSVARRSHEIGLRLALGAGRGQVLSLVVRQGLKWSAIGVVIGLAAALAGCRLLAGFLFGVAPHDPLAFAVAGAVPLVVALLASCIPARRASRIEPATALRSE
jgi:putative ABC transport system permease protein